MYVLCVVLRDVACLALCVLVCDGVACAVIIPFSSLITDCFAWCSFKTLENIVVV